MASMDRRALLQRALLLVGATVATGGCSFLPSDEPFELNEGQMAVLAAMADTIMPETDTPGAIQVGVPARLAEMLNTWASPETREEFVRVLGDIEGLSGAGGSFVDASAEDRHEMLVAHDMAAMQPGEEMEDRFFGRLAAAPVDAAYGRLKDLILTLYYTSEEAMTQELVYTLVPGRWDPSIPVTPDTRPWGGVSLL